MDHCPEMLFPMEWGMECKMYLQILWYFILSYTENAHHLHLGITDSNQASARCFFSIPLNTFQFLVLH